MVDAVRDQPGAIDERDLVGDGNAPAGFHAVDGQFLYLRLRVDNNPIASGGNLHPFAWGFAFSTDAQPVSYEVLVTLAGTARVVGLYRNTIATVPDSPADPADTLVATYPLGTHARTVAAASNFGGNRDHFIDMAIPWSDLMPLGLAPSTSVVTWAGSSSSPDSLNGDIACHNAQGSTASPSLSGSASGTTTPSDTTPPPGGGGAGGAGGAGGSGPSGLGGIGLEGGPGCTCALPGGPTPGPPIAAILIAAAILIRKRKT
jgi:hypothetical protein